MHVVTLFVTLNGIWLLISRGVEEGGWGYGRWDFREDFFVYSESICWIFANVCWTIGRFENFLLLGGYLRLRFRGLFFGRAYFWEGLLSEFYCILDNVGQYLKTPVEIGRKWLFLTELCFSWVKMDVTHPSYNDWVSFSPGPLFRRRTLGVAARKIAKPAFFEIST